LRNFKNIMTEKVYGNGYGTGVNDIHSEIPPIIHVHNKTPFDDYDTAVMMLKQKTINPGEIIIAYYKDPEAEDGISSLIATGPLVEGGDNDLFKSADEIDRLVTYFEGLIGS